MARLLDVDNVTAGYEGIPVVREISFHLAPGSIGCLLGPSGCGKTTVLRAIAGFEPLIHGEIRLHGQTVSTQGWTLPPERRRVGMVFQDFALFPHLSVAANVAFGLRHLPESQRRNRVKELLVMVGLPDYGKLFPHQLSGGEQQRVALARAIAPQPSLLLLDEPFSSMDVDLREQLAREVRGILKQEDISGMLVTHDQLEAFAMADEIGVIQGGWLHQWDSAYNLYHQPANRFVADFIGQGVFLKGTVLNDREVETEFGIIDADAPESLSRGKLVDILVRPDDIMVSEQAGDIIARVENKVFRGAEYLYTLCLPSGSKLLCLAPSHFDFPKGEKIAIEARFDHVVMFPR